MNDLQYASSPYLRQHAADPVDWRPWTEASLELAKSRDKAILLSIGYSTCHWCHVMQRESFADPGIAQLMNEWFINIKVDREERPDLDALYQDAAQVLAGTTGWPLQVFLTPELEPFFAGTYFPPEPDHKRLSWLQALQFAHYNFTEQRPAVQREVQRVMRRLARQEAEAGISTELSPSPGDELSHQLFIQLQSQFDTTYGGFGSGRKFPNLPALEFLLNYHYYHRDTAALRHLRFSLNTMLKSGLYDQIGGGIFRYAVDRAWRVPHFEKMLYDNALLVQVLDKAHRYTGRRKYRTAMLETLAFLERELRGPEGGFYAALDADSHGQEGSYYTWTKAEIEAVLGSQAGLFCTYFGVSEEGNWEGTNMLYQPLDRFDYAAELSVDREELLETMHAARRRLLAVRLQERSVHRDEKVILGWNALMVSAYVQAYLATGTDGYARSARELLSWLLTDFRRRADGGYFRILMDGAGRQEGVLRDYAYLIRALLDVFLLTNERALLQRADQLAQWMDRHFLEPEAVLYNFSVLDQKDLLLARKDLKDDDIVSGNALMAYNLQELGILLDRPEYRRRSVAMAAAVRQLALREPLAYGSWCSALLAAAAGWLEIVTAGADAWSWKAAVDPVFVPFRLSIATTEPAADLPLLEGKYQPGRTQVYVCRDYTCRQPLDNPEDFKAAYFKPPDLS